MSAALDGLKSPKASRAENLKFKKSDGPIHFIYDKKNKTVDNIQDLMCG